MLNIFLYKHSTPVSCHSVHIIQGHRSSAILWLLVFLAFVLCTMKTIIDLNNLPSFFFKRTKEGEEFHAATFFWFGFNVIELTSLWMKVRSESKYYHSVASLLPSWPCGNSKCEIASFDFFFFSVFGTRITLPIRVCVSVCTFGYGCRSWGCFLWIAVLRQH